MKLLFLYTIFNLSFSTQAEAQQRDFGPTGIEGLSVEQLVKLYNGSILFLTTDPAKSGGTSSLTEAAVMFTVPPETAWKLISKTVDQPKYIDGCIEVKVIHTSPGTSYEVRKVGNFMVTYTYGVIQNFLPEKKCLYWSLDTTYAENDLNSLHGYWQLYPYANGRTLGRYGNQISFKNLPAFIEKGRLKSGVKDALTAVKKYVDSGGTYRK